MLSPSSSPVFRPLPERQAGRQCFHKGTGAWPPKPNPSFEIYFDPGGARESIFDFSSSIPNQGRSRMGADEISRSGKNGPLEKALSLLFLALRLVVWPYQPSINDMPPAPIRPCGLPVFLSRGSFWATGRNLLPLISNIPTAVIVRVS